jgi:hypothetical protein
MKMHITLREGDLDPHFIQTQLDLLHGVEIDAPVFGGRDPGAYSEIDAAVGKLQNGNHRLRILQDPGIRADDLEENPITRSILLVLFLVKFVRLSPARLPLGMKMDSLSGVFRCVVKIPSSSTEPITPAPQSPPLTFLASSL